MSDVAFAALGDNVQGHMKEAAGKMTGDDELQAEGRRQQAEADGVEQDETETDPSGQGDSGTALDDVDLEPPSS